MCICIALKYTGCLDWYDTHQLIIGHFIIDKYSRNHTKGGPNTWTFYFDQCLHLLQCFVAWSI